MVSIVKKVYFSEAPVEVVKEQDKGLKKLGADVIIPAMLGHVVQAFTLLKSRPEAQCVVASLASDKNVWEFYKTQQQTMVHTFPEDTPQQSFQRNLNMPPPVNASPFSDFVDNAKKTVMQIVDDITNFFQDITRQKLRPEGTSMRQPDFNACILFK